MEQELKEKQDETEATSICSTKSSISLQEPETQSELMVKLLAILSIEKIPGVLAVRKGRVRFVMFFIKLNFSNF